MSDGGGMIRITLVRSPIGRQPAQKKTVRALGLKKMNHSVIQKDSPEIMGMVNRVRHLVKVEPWEAGSPAEAAGTVARRKAAKQPPDGETG
jgi:large subunit ribosomal protein L30